MSRLNRNEVGSNATYGAVTANTTAVQVALLKSQRVSLTIRNAGTSDIFFGTDSSVTTATGYPVHIDEEYVFDDYVGPVWVISTTSNSVRFLEVT